MSLGLSASALYWATKAFSLYIKVLVASLRCLTSAIPPIESEMKRTFLLFDVGKREKEDDCCGVGAGLVG